VSLCFANVNRIILHIANVIEIAINIPTFVKVGNSLALYVKNLTTVESITIVQDITKINTKHDFLLKVKEKAFLIKLCYEQIR